MAMCVLVARQTPRPAYQIDIRFCMYHTSDIIVDWQIMPHIQNTEKRALIFTRIAFVYSFVWSASIKWNRFSVEKPNIRLRFKLCVEARDDQLLADDLVDRYYFYIARGATNVRFCTNHDTCDRCAQMKQSLLGRHACDKMAHIQSRSWNRPVWDGASSSNHIANTNDKNNS